MTTADQAGGPVPVEQWEFAPEACPAHTLFRKMDAIQDRTRPFFRSEEAPGYWVFTEHDVILEGMQHPELFSNGVLVVTEPDPAYKWIPIMLDPPEHTKWRQLLASYFSPRRIEGMEADQRAFAARVIGELAEKGRCDFYTEYAMVFPTTIFLEIMGMPTDQLPRFMEWENRILHTSKAKDPDQSLALGAMLEVVDYFRSEVESRRADPSRRGQDIISHAIGWEIDGAPVTDDDLLNCLLLLFMAGLDTVAAGLSYSFFHLATHPGDRARIVRDPAVIPNAVEELLRAYPIVQTGRRAVGDFDFHGCPVRDGDMVAFPTAFAGRDEKTYPDARVVDFDRAQTRHLSFGAGPHRCLGSHLARQELVITMEEWHRRIPEYTVADLDRVQEHGGGVYSLESLPLVWDS